MKASVLVRKRVVSYAAVHSMTVDEAWEVLGGLITYGLLYLQPVFVGVDTSEVPGQPTKEDFDWWNLTMGSTGMSPPPECSPFSSDKSAGCVEHTEFLANGQKNPYYGLGAGANSKSKSGSMSIKASGGFLQATPYGSTKGWDLNAPATKWATGPLVNPIPSVTIKLPNTFAFKFSGVVHKYSDESTTLSLSHQDVDNLKAGLSKLGSSIVGGVPNWAQKSDGTPSTLLEKKVLAFGISHLKSMNWAWKELALSTIWPNYPPPIDESTYATYAPNELFMSMASYHWDDLAQFLALRGCHMTPTNHCSCMNPEVKPLSKEKEPTKVAKGRQVVLVAEKEGCSLIIPKGFRTAVI